MLDDASTSSVTRVTSVATMSSTSLPAAPAMTMLPRLPVICMVSSLNDRIGGSDEIHPGRRELGERFVGNPRKIERRGEGTHRWRGHRARRVFEDVDLLHQRRVDLSDVLLHVAERREHAMRLRLAEHVDPIEVEQHLEECSV